MKNAKRERVRRTIYFDRHKKIVSFKKWKRLKPGNRKKKIVSYTVYRSRLTGRLISKGHMRDNADQQLVQELLPGKGHRKSTEKRFSGLQAFAELISNLDDEEIADFVVLYPHSGRAVDDMIKAARLFGDMDLAKVRKVKRALKLSSAQQRRHDAKSKKRTPRH